jgi:hypothetical protein
MAKNHELIASMLDSFYEKVAFEKKANETLASVEKKDEKTSSKPSMGAAGNEMNSELSTPNQTGGTEATSAEAQTKPADTVVSESSEGPHAMASDEAVKEGENKIKVESEHKEARAERLGNAILRHVGDLRKQATQAAPAPVQKVQHPLEKLASENPALKNKIDESYVNFSEGWLRGFEKKAEDINSMVASGVVKTAAEAEAILEKIAAEDPAAVMPEEAMAAMPAEGAPAEAGAEAGAEDPAAAVANLAPEEQQALEQLAAEMAAQGVKPEDVVAAAQAIEELQAAGVAPEEIVQAASELQGEGAAPEAAAEAPAEKMAAERKNLIKDYIRGLNA